MSRRGIEINGGQPVGGVDGSAPVDNAKNGETSLDFMRNKLGTDSPDANAAAFVGAQALYEIGSKRGGDPMANAFTYQDKGATVLAGFDHVREARGMVEASTDYADALNRVEAKSNGEPTYSAMDKLAIGTAAAFNALTGGDKEANLRYAQEQLKTIEDRFSSPEAFAKYKEKVEAGLCGDVDGEHGHIAQAVGVGTAAWLGRDDALPYAMGLAAEATPLMCDPGFSEWYGKKDALRGQSALGPLLGKFTLRDSLLALVDFGGDDTKSGFIDNLRKKYGDAESALNPFLHPFRALREKVENNISKIGQALRGVEVLDKKVIDEMFTKQGLERKKVAGGGAVEVRRRHG